MDISHDGNSCLRCRVFWLLENGERIAAKRMSPGAKIPSEDFHAGRIEEAVKAYRALYAAKADDPGVAEARLNRLGYDFLGHKEYAKAIAILRLNTEFYAASPNANDSLAEAYLASGDHVRALETYRAVLKVLPNDDKTDPATKEQLRRNAEAKISKLSRGFGGDAFASYRTADAAFTKLTI
jgi:tetratricopeptide (TPR) repeat protein